ncbi:MAG TPA: HAMP domain-containing sensor histidine kinase [Mucilaginibacter sp.]
MTVGVLLVLLVLAYYYIRTRSFNKQLSLLNQELKASNDVKDKMFSIIGHDLRAPLATVRNFLYVLDSDELDNEEKERIIKSLIENCDASLDILNQLLKWGQLQIKGVLLNQTIFDAGQVIEHNLSLFKNIAKEKDITITAHTYLRLILYADPDHFDFIVRNLLSNAIKFTPDGGKIKIGSDGVQQDGYIRFYVEDTGIGMSPEHAKHIFDRNHVSMDGTRGEKGTSLGLLMCKEYTEANGGTINVKSIKGQGTTFTFTMKACSDAEINDFAS